MYKGEPVERGIVEILTDSKARTSIWQPKQDNRIISEIIGINSVSHGKPTKWGNGIYERGFWNPDKMDELYFIDSENQLITVLPVNKNLFYDQDKVSGNNEYVWHGNFEDILNEFRDGGYEIENGK